MSNVIWDQIFYECCHQVSPTFYLQFYLKEKKYDMALFYFEKSLIIAKKIYGVNNIKTKKIIDKITDVKESIE